MYLKYNTAFRRSIVNNIYNRHDFPNHSVEVCFAMLVNLLRRNEDLIRIINCELSQARSTKASSRSVQEVPYGIVYNA